MPSAAHGFMGAFEALTISSHRLCRWDLTGRSKAGTRPAKKVCNLFREGVAVKYARIETLRQDGNVAAMCRALNVSESGYHAWRKQPPSAHAQEDSLLEIEIKAAHQRTRETRMARSGYKPTWLTTGSQSVYIESIAYARNSGCAVSKSASSSQPRTPRIRCRLRRTCSTGNSP